MNIIKFIFVFLSLIILCKARSTSSQTSQDPTMFSWPNQEDMQRSSLNMHEMQKMSQMNQNQNKNNPDQMRMMRRQMNEMQENHQNHQNNNNNMMH